MRVLRPDRAVTVRPYERKDRSDVRDLSFYNFNVHVHLDWQTVDEYLLTNPPRMWVAHKHGKLVGVIGLSDTLSGISWIRLAAADDSERPRVIFGQMWERVCAELAAEDVKQVAVLVMRDFIDRFMADAGFQYVEDIVTLRRYGRKLPPPPPERPELHIRHMEAEHYSAVTGVDHAAFAPPWQLTRGEIRLGARMSAYSSIAVVNEKAIGYQIATTHGMNGHLARLGVVPQIQGHGVGGVILRDMIEWFMRRNVLTITVNTQESNIRSQKLYEKYGFHRNGYDLPVWTVDL
ncbi:MAG: GNAT family N-acetyltransferase [Chloroflexota bacterium]